MSRYDSLVSAEAWTRMVRRLTELRDEDDRDGDDLDDYEIAEIVRNEVFDVEGEEL